VVLVAGSSPVGQEPEKALSSSTVISPPCCGACGAADEGETVEAVCVLHAATPSRAARRTAIPCFCNVIRVLLLRVIAAR
jgi:hypothetical protein